ncbi:MAG: hypothetical protein GC136_05955 [Alphaproteobacteria bacterium]|nr:hypothetical protein [Alphaproteobacteria bacterium]
MKKLFSAAGAVQDKESRAAMIAEMQKRASSFYPLIKQIGEAAGLHVSRDKKEVRFWGDREIANEQYYIRDEPFSNSQRLYVASYRLQHDRYSIGYGNILHPQKRFDDARTNNVPDQIAYALGLSFPEKAAEIDAAVKKYKREQLVKRFPILDFRLSSLLPA